MSELRRSSVTGNRLNQPNKKPKKGIIRCTSDISPFRGLFLIDRKRTPQQNIVTHNLHVTSSVTHGRVLTLNM